MAAWAAIMANARKPIQKQARRARRKISCRRVVILRARTARQAAMKARASIWFPIFFVNDGVFGFPTQPRSPDLFVTGTRRFLASNHATGFEISLGRKK